MLYDFFWVIPRRLNFTCRRFGTLGLFHLRRQVGVCMWNELGGPLPSTVWSVLDLPLPRHPPS
jgi:hypothetical protein